jgi:hypothetical protein
MLPSGACPTIIEVRDETLDHLGGSDALRLRERCCPGYRRPQAVAASHQCRNLTNLPISAKRYPLHTIALYIYPQFFAIVTCGAQAQIRQLSLRFLSRRHDNKRVTRVAQRLLRAIVVDCLAWFDAQCI